MTEKKYPEFLIDTDILNDYLVSDKSVLQTYLVRLLLKGVGFTTVINASEIMLKARNEYQENACKSVLSSLKILGLHSRYSLKVNKVSHEITKLRDILFIVTAEINKLDIVSLTPSNYNSKIISILHPEEIF